MTCQNCRAGVENKIAQISSVSSVSVSLELEEAILNAPRLIEPKEIEELLGSKYTVKAVSEASSQDKVSKWKELRPLFEKGGKYAKFLGCSRKGVLIIGSNLFVHGGIVPKLAKEYGGKKGIDDINKIISRFLWNKLADKDNFSSITGTLDYSPFWNRLLGTLPSNLSMEDHYCQNNIKPVLDIYNVERIVVGHTPQFMNDQGINSTCKGSVWRADVGVSKAFDKTDRQIRMGSTRNDNRNIQVLEILEDGKKINILR